MDLGCRVFMDAIHARGTFEEKLAADNLMTAHNQFERAIARIYADLKEGEFTRQSIVAAGQSVFMALHAIIMVIQRREDDEVHKLAEKDKDHAAE